MSKGPILLTTINAKWIHPSLGLRLLKANLGALEGACEILEFALRQSPEERVRAIRDRRPGVLGISVAIWNHAATLDLLRALEGEWAAAGEGPAVVLGGPELWYLPEGAEIFRHADYVIRGEAETRFRELCEALLGKGQCAGPEGPEAGPARLPCCRGEGSAHGMAEGPGGTAARGEPRRARFIDAAPADLALIRQAYRYYSDEDVARKLVYVESSRGCPFRCAFCQSAVPADFAAPPAATAAASVRSPATSGEPSASAAASARSPAAPSTPPPRTAPSAPPPRAPGTRVREFPLEPFLAELDLLIRRGARNFKFLDRTFNANIPRALRIMDFFLEHIEARREEPPAAPPGPEGPEPRRAPSSGPPCVHFEMVSAIFPPELRDRLRRFPPGTLRLEIGIQTLNPHTAALTGLPGAGEAALGILRELRRDTNAIIHADLIAGLPGEDLDSFGRGFDALWLALSGPAALSSPAGQAPSGPAVPPGQDPPAPGGGFEIQPGILKLLPGTPLARYAAPDTRYAPEPPYEVLSTASLPRPGLDRIKNFARFWELIMNRGAFPDPALFPPGRPVFRPFMDLADRLLGRFGRNWGIDRRELREAIQAVDLFNNPVGY